VFRVQGLGFRVGGEFLLYEPLSANWAGDAAAFDSISVGAREERRRRRRIYSYSMTL
jgi:hypothetical protein